MDQKNTSHRKIIYYSLGFVLVALIGLYMWNPDDMCYPSEESNVPSIQLYTLQESDTPKYVTPVPCQPIEEKTIIHQSQEKQTLPSVVSVPHKRTTSKAKPKRVSLPEGYNDGYEDGYEDGSNRDRGANYEPKKTTKTYLEDYEEGYSEGWYDGFNDYREDFAGEDDDEDDEW